MENNRGKIEKEKDVKSDTYLCNSFVIKDRVPKALSCWKPPNEGMVIKVNTDASFISYIGVVMANTIVRNHRGEIIFPSPIFPSNL